MPSSIASTTWRIATLAPSVTSGGSSDSQRGPSTAAAAASAATARGGACRGAAILAAAIRGAAARRSDGSDGATARPWVVWSASSRRLTVFDISAQKIGRSWPTMHVTCRSRLLLLCVR